MTAKTDYALSEAEEDNDYHHELSNIRDSFVAVAFVAAVIMIMLFPMW